MNDQHEHQHLPPRHRLHPSSKGRWNRRFFAALVVLFIVLIVSLGGWFYLYGM